MPDETEETSTMVEGGFSSKMLPNTTKANDEARCGRRDAKATEGAARAGWSTTFGTDTSMIRLRGDFNGCWADYLCLSHGDHATDEHGGKVALTEGMQVLAFEAEAMPGEPSEYLVVTGETVRSPEPLCGNGSRWAVKIDSRGIRRVARLDDA